MIFTAYVTAICSSYAWIGNKKKTSILHTNLSRFINTLAQRFLSVGVLSLASIKMFLQRNKYIFDSEVFFSCPDEEGENVNNGFLCKEWGKRACERNWVPFLKLLGHPQLLNSAIILIEAEINRSYWSAVRPLFGSCRVDTLDETDWRNFSSLVRVRLASLSYQVELFLWQLFEMVSKHFVLAWNRFCAKDVKWNGKWRGRNWKRNLCDHRDKTCLECQRQEIAGALPPLSASDF